MSKLRLELDGSTFEPGERVSGRVRWQLLEEQVKTLLISLVWHTEGKGTEDAETVAQVEIPSPAPTGNERFSFDLPAYPWSFSGTLISLVWTVEASLEPRGDLERAELLVAPGRQERIF